MPYLANIPADVIWVWFGDVLYNTGRQSILSGSEQPLENSFFQIVG